MDFNLSTRVFPRLSGSQLRIMDKIDGALCNQRSPEWQVERMVDDILRICAEADSAYRLSKTLKDPLGSGNHNLWSTISGQPKSGYSPEICPDAS